MPDLVVNDREGVRVVTLNRPDVLNAFDTPLYQACGDAIRDAQARDHVKCVVLTGAGRAFSSGQDLAEMAAIDPSASGVTHGFPALIDTVATFEKPFLCAVNGVAIGVGMTVLLHADIALIDETARLRAPFAPLGVVPEAAGSVLMPAIMGNQRAALALYTGDWITADEAVAAGLALRTVPAGTALDETLAIAERIAAMPLASLVETKRLVIAGRIDAIRAARAREDAAFARLLGGGANAAALQAFLGGG